MVKLGIIGFGYWGPNLVRNFNSTKGSEVSYCADLDESRLSHIKELYPNTNATKDYKEILSSDVDAVIIATPIETHYKLAKEALEAGKHVLIEKPITADSKEAKDLIETAKKSNKVLMVDHTFEYSSPVRKIKEIIDSKELGDILTIDMIRVNLGLFQEKVNVIWDLAPHDVSMLIYCLNKLPKTVRAIGQSYVREGIEDDAHINMEFDNKVMVNMHVSWLDPMKIRKTTIVGNKKMLVFDDTLDKEKIKIFDKGVIIEKGKPPRQPYYDTFEQWKLTYKQGDTKAVDFENKESLSVMAAHFIDCIKNNKKPLSDGLSGLNVVKVIEAMQQSLKNDGEKVLIR